MFMTAFILSLLTFTNISYASPKTIYDGPMVPVESVDSLPTVEPIAEVALEEQAKIVVHNTVPSSQSSYRVGSVSSSGNTYDPGQCTWGVKQWRPDVPNGLGNANRWVGNAQALGMATGSTPRAGAVGQANKGMHVVLVLAVQGDQVLIREMNYDYVPFHERTILKPASNYTYIY